MERMTKVDENIQTAQNLLSWIVERCYELEEENKRLKEEKEIRALNDRDNLIQIEKLEKENKRLKLDLSECECSFWFENDEVWYRKRECKKLKEELKKYKKLHKYSNWELLTYSGD